MAMAMAMGWERRKVRDRSRNEQGKEVSTSRVVV